MRTFAIAALVGSVSADVYFSAGDAPKCSVINGETLIQYGSDWDIHPSFKCSHTSATTCVCTNKHPTHHTGLCKEYTHHSGKNFVIGSGDCSSTGLNAIDGGWTGFSAWGACTKSCGPGTQTRARTCTNPAPFNGGAQCAGAASETQSCNNGPCHNGENCDGAANGSYTFNNGMVAECKDGWIVIQKRISSSNFYQNWNAYATGFGDANNYWLGNNNIHELTKWGPAQLRVELTAGSESRYAQYSSFQVGSAATKYQLSVSGYSGNAGDSLNSYHSNRKFSTYDQDNDAWGSNCASQFKGAWWYGSCHYSNLNGVYHGGDHGSYADGMNWYHWKGYHHSMTKSYMMIKPVATPAVSTSCNGATGKRMIKPDSGSPIEVECKNGWMVIQKRTSSSNFYQNWNAYANGFGDDNNFWLGNDKIHRLCKVTSGARVELTAGSESRYAEYSSFSVGNAASKYQLSVSGYSGNAGDSLNSYHSNRKFSTYDQDNDAWGSNCASQFKGAWWYGSCHYSNLNGMYHGGDHGSYADGMNWYHWKGYHHSMTKSYIMIK